MPFRCILSPRKLVYMHMRPLTSLSTAMFVLASLAASPAPAQQPASAPQAPAPAPASTITVDAKLVIVPAIVRDRKNALVPNLTRENFALTVDGKPQTLRYFDHDSNFPLTVGLLIDTSQSVRSQLDEERAASSTFLDKMLSLDRDKAFIMQFAHGAELLQDVTNSRPKLQQALKEVDTANPTLQRSDNSNVNEFQQQGDHHGYGHGGQNSSGGTVLYDAVFLASDEVINKQQGRRALILLTDGDDRGSLKSLTQAIEAAQRADTMIYAIYYKGEDHGGYNPGFGGHHGGFPGQHFQGRGGYGQRPDGKKILERMAGETGGRVYEVSKKETVEKIYAEIGEELRSQYRLGFTPSTEAASEGYHKIFITLAGQPDKDKDQVFGRDGYYR
jgi:VWFA-related protein